MARKILDANGDPLTGTTSLLKWVLDRFGIVGFLCLAFAYLLFWTMPKALADVGADVKASREEHRQQSQYLREQTLYLYGLCVMTAKDEKQRAMWCGAAPGR